MVGTGRFKLFFHCYIYYVSSMIRARNIFIFILAMFCFIATPGNAQTANHTTSVMVNKISSITITGSNTLSITNVADYTGSYIQNSYWTVQVKANSSWKVVITSSAATWSNSGTSSTAGMPSSVLSYKKNGDLTWIPLSNTTTASVATGTKGDETVAGNTFTVDLKASPGYIYGPGVYSITIVFTSTAL
jgi:hypothetical protein